MPTVDLLYLFWILYSCTSFYIIVYYIQNGSSRILYTIQFCSRYNMTLWHWVCLARDINLRSGLSSTANSHSSASVAEACSAQPLPSNPMRRRTLTQSMHGLPVSRVITTLYYIFEIRIHTSCALLVITVVLRG